MAKHFSSTAALQDILSSSEASDDAIMNEESESEVDKDCEIVESNDGADNENCAPTTLSTAAVLLLSTTTVSLLTVLKACSQSDLARKRKVAVNSPPKGKCSSKSVNSKAAICIKPDQHVKEFPNEHFTVLNEVIL